MLARRRRSQDQAVTLHINAALHFRLIEIMGMICLLPRLSFLLCLQRKTPIKMAIKYHSLVQVIDAEGREAAGICFKEN
jgi:hypothetical protein